MIRLALVAALAALLGAAGALTATYRCLSRAWPGAASSGRSNT